MLLIDSMLHLFIHLGFLDQCDSSMLWKFNTGQLYLHEAFSLGMSDGWQKHASLTNDGRFDTL